MKNYRKQINTVVGSVLELSEDSISSINETDDLRNYNLDSMRAVQLLAELEDEFEIIFMFDDMNIEGITTLKQIYNLLEKYKGEDFE